MPQSVKEVGLVILGVFVAVIVLGSISGEEDRGYSGRSPQEMREYEEQKARREAQKIEREARECEETTMAFIMAQELVTKRLKAPSTSEFPGAYADDVSTEYLGDCRHIIRAYVDAQNSFGAQIRSNYTATVRYDGDGTWALESLSMN